MCEVLGRVLYSSTLQVFIIGQVESSFGFLLLHLYVPSRKKFEQNISQFFSLLRQVLFVFLVFYSLHLQLNL